MRKGNVIFAVDPSTHSTGIAVFLDKKLIHVECISVPSAFTGKLAVSYMATQIRVLFLSYVKNFDNVNLVIEDQEWRSNNERMKPMAFAVLYGLVCAVYAMCFMSNNEKRIYAYTPRKWKGTVPKKIKCTRIYNAEPNKDILKKANSDILDAVGIGRYHIERNIDGKSK